VNVGIIGLGRAGWRDLICDDVELVEKPMAVTLAQADHMIEAAREAAPAGARILHTAVCRHSYNRRCDWQTLRRFGGGQAEGGLTGVLRAGLPHPAERQGLSDHAGGGAQRRVGDPEGPQGLAAGLTRCRAASLSRM